MGVVRTLGNTVSNRESRFGLLKYPGRHMSLDSQNPIRHFYLEEIEYMTVCPFELMSHVKLPSFGAET